MLSPFKLFMSYSKTASDNYPELAFRTMTCIDLIQIQKATTKTTKIPTVSSLFPPVAVNKTTEILSQRRIGIKMTIPTKSPPIMTVKEVASYWHRSLSYFNLNNTADRCFPRAL